LKKKSHSAGGRGNRRPERGRVGTQRGSVVAEEGKREEKLRGPSPMKEISRRLRKLGGVPQFFIGGGHSGKRKTRQLEEHKEDREIFRRRF